MTHSNTSHFKNIIAIVIFIAFIAVEFLYVKNGDIFAMFKKENVVSDEAFDAALNKENNFEQDAMISSASNLLENTNENNILNDTEKKEIKFATVSEAYFNNSLFIGDSRTEGFRIYKDIPGVTYYCNPSFGVYSGFNRTMELPYFGIITLGDLLYVHKFDKIYICLGINNIATSIDNHKQMYEQFLTKIRELQPNAIIFLIANLQVTREQSGDKYVNAENINLINSFIKDFADNEDIFFLDPNPLYVNEEGYIPGYLSNDGCHIKARHYDKYLEFLLGHGIIKE